MQLPGPGSRFLTLKCAAPASRFSWCWSRLQERPTVRHGSLNAPGRRKHSLFVFFFPFPLIFMFLAVFGRQQCGLYALLVEFNLENGDTNSWIDGKLEDGVPPQNSPPLEFPLMCL